MWSSTNVYMTGYGIELLTIFLSPRQITLEFQVIANALNIVVLLGSSRCDAASPLNHSTLRKKEREGGEARDPSLGRFLPSSCIVSSTERRCSFISCVVFLGSLDPLFMLSSLRAQRQLQPGLCRAGPNGYSRPAPLPILVTWVKLSEGMTSGSP